MVTEATLWESPLIKKGMFKMKRITAFCLAVFVALVFAATNADAARPEREKPQQISEFGDEVCGIMKTNPAGMLDLVPLRFVMRVALAGELGGEDSLAEFLAENSMSISELIELSLKEADMTDENGNYREGMGAEYFGEKPVAECRHFDAKRLDCEDLYEKLEVEGLMNGTVPATTKVLAASGREFDIQGCSTLRMITSDENLLLTMFMFDNYWTLVGMLALTEDENK